MTEIKASTNREKWNDMDSETIGRLQNRGNGVSNFFFNMVDDILESGCPVVTLEEVYKFFISSISNDDYSMRIIESSQEPDS